MQTRPTFSVIVPTLDRPRALAALLSSLARMSYRDFEVIIVDDGSVVPVARLLANPRLSGLSLSVVRQPNGGPAQARNAGAERARGRYLAFTDDDCCVDPSWLSVLARAHGRLPGHACAGRTVCADERNVYSLAHHVLLQHLCDKYSACPRVGAFFPSNNLCVPRDGFLDVGGFDPTMRFGEDRDFCDRWTADGHGLAYVPEALVRHAHELDALALARLHFRYGGGSFQFWKRALGRRGATKLDLSAPAFYLDLFLGGLGPGRRPRRVYALLALTQGANLAGMCFEALRDVLPPPC